MSSISNEKKWKYLSFALMGILGTGLLSTQAYGANPTLTDIMNKLLRVDTKVTAIQAKTDNLPADPASNTNVNTRATPTDITNAQAAINSHTDSAIASTPK